MKMFTKIQVEIMKVFVSKINRNFSIKQIAEILDKEYPLIHRSIKPLIEREYLLRDEQGLISLNYRKNHSELSFIESIRKINFLDKNKNFELFFKECLKNLNVDFFILMVFGSSVEQKGRDIDLLFIFPEDKFEKKEKIIQNIAENYTFNMDLNVISVKSVYEMLSKREEANVLNESLNKHIILFGGENFYRILDNARR